MMRIIFILPILLFLLSACTTNGIDSALYKDGKNIIQMTNKNLSSGKVQYSNNQETQVDNFQSKYTSNLRKLSGKDISFYHTIFMAYMAYRQYGENRDVKYLDKYHKYVNELQNKYNLKVD